jgi:hypothetical protein
VRKNLIELILTYNCTLQSVIHSRHAEESRPRSKVQSVFSRDTPLSRGLIRRSGDFEPIELKETPSCCRSCSDTFLVVELVQASCSANKTAAGSNKSSSEVPGERLNVETL